jgi:hypothetical protein
MKSKFIWLFLLTLALVSLGSQAFADWNTSQGDQQRTGLSPYAVDESKLRLAWNYDLNSTGQRATASSPAIYGTNVYATWGGGAAATRVVSSHDLATGLLNWTSVLLPGGSRTTPAVYNVDTTGSGDFAVLVFVGNGSTTSGVAGVDALRASDGTLFKRYLLGLGEGGVIGSTPVLVDTGGVAGPDLVIAGTSRLASLHAWDVRTAATSWSIVGLEAAATFTILNSVALSADDSIVYAGTGDFGVSWAGHVYAVDTRTGAILGNIFRAGSSFVANPTVLGSGEVLSLGFNSLATGFARRVYLSPRLLGTFNRTPFDNGNQRGGGALWPDVSGDTIYYASSEDFNLLIGWSVQAIRAFTNNPASLVALQTICDFPPSPVAISASGTGIVSTGFFGAYNEVNIFDPATGFLLWNKPYVGANTVTGFNRSNAAIADGAANDSGVVVVLQDAAGFLIALNEDPTGFARWELEPAVSVGDACPELFMNIPLAFNGTDTDTADFINVGTASGSYTAIVAMAAQAGATGKSSMQVRYSNVSRSRQNLALKVSDDLAATAKGKFLPKSTASFLSEIPDERAEEFLQATSFQLKQKLSAQTASPPPVWLTLTDLDGGGPIAPGGTASVEAVASSATLALGEYFADIELTVTPDDPDPDYYGGTEVIYPVHLLVGFAKAAAYCDASDASLAISNVGFFGPEQGVELFYWAGNDPHQLFAGGLVIASPGYVWDATYDDHGDFLQDADILSGVTLNPSPYVAEVHICSTAFTTVAGACSLRIQQYYIGLWDGAFCDSMITQKNYIYNMGSTPCTLCVGYFMDWDFPPSDFASDTVAADPAHGIIWVENVNTPGQIVGVMRVPTDDVPAFLVGVDNPTSIYNTTNPVVDDTLTKWWNTTPGTFNMYGASNGPDDKSVVIGSPAVVLNPGEYYLNENIIFGWDPADVPFDQVVWKAWLRQLGYYRGDVNTDNRGHERNTAGADLGPAIDGGKINVTDIVYLVKYVMSGGTTASPWPFTDQGDFTGEGSVTFADVIILVNFVFKGQVPNDRNRFGPGTRLSLKENPNWY